MIEMNEKASCGKHLLHILTHNIKILGALDPSGRYSMGRDHPSAFQRFSFMVLRGSLESTWEASPESHTSHWSVLHQVIAFCLEPHSGMRNGETGETVIQWRIISRKGSDPEAREGGTKAFERIAAHE